MNSGASRFAQSRRRLRARAHGIDLGRRRAARGGVHHFPGERRAVRRILTHEPVQMRRAGPRQADDEHGVGDALSARSRDCAALCSSSRNRFSSRLTTSSRTVIRPSVVRSRLVAIGLEQPFERLLDRPRAERGSTPARRSAARSKSSRSSEGGSAPSRRSARPPVFKARHRAAHAACGKAHR